jgi:hypothetical protein
VKCSECSREVRPVVALDIDGTMARYHEALVEFVINYTGMEPGPAVPLPGRNGVQRIGGDFGDWVCFAWGLDRRVYREIKLAFRQGGQKRFMPVVPYASELAAAALEEGGEIWVTTSRPYLRLDNIDPDTREWLKRNFIAWDYMVYGEDKYTRLAELVDPKRVVAVLDDIPEMYDQAAHVFGPEVPILAQTAWNRGAEEAPGGRHRLAVNGLLDARAMVVARIQDWKHQCHFDHLPTTN